MSALEEACLFMREGSAEGGAAKSRSKRPPPALDEGFWGWAGAVATGAAAEGGERRSKPVDELALVEGCACGAGAEAEAAG
jgi:hypothetical protein